MKESPNLFQYAPSELSQDAMLIWLLQWANSEYVDNKLYKVGIAFLQSLFAKANLTCDVFDELTVLPQVDKIDILVEVKSSDKITAIVIEDKVKSSEQSDQLSRYLNKVQQKHYDQVIPIYLKTGFQHDLEKVKAKRYLHYSVHDLLEVFQFGKSINVENDIFHDFFEHLKRLKTAFDDAKNSFTNFRDKSVHEWDWWNWIGFFNMYQEPLNAKWGVVPNGRERLVAFWFGGMDKNIPVNGATQVFHPYIDIKYSETHRYFSTSFRLDLKGKPQTDSKVRDTVIQQMENAIRASNLEVKIPKFRKAKHTVELMRLTHLNPEMRTGDLAFLLHKMHQIISEF